MNRTSLKSLIILSFIITPFIALFFPANEDVAIAIIEGIAEFWILTEIIIFSLRNKKNSTWNYDLIAIGASILCVFIADTIDNINVIITHKGELLFFYTGFVFFMLIFLVKELNFLQRNINEWLWIFLAGLVLFGLLTCWFILVPYFNSHPSWELRIEASLYSILSVIMFALILSVAFRVQDRRTFWFLNLLILLLTSDFAIRYHDDFITTNSFSWAEIGWCSTFIGLAWLIRTGRREKNPFISQPLVLAPIISIRSLLSLSICCANILFLIGILFLKLYSIETAVDITNLLLLLFIFWTIANEFSIWLAKDLSHTLKHMFKSKEQLIKDGIIEFNLEPVPTKNHIFEIAKILESYNELTEQTNKMILVVIEKNKKASMDEVAFQVSHDIRSPLAALDMTVKTLPELPEEGRLLIRSSIYRIKDIANNLTQNNAKYLRSGLNEINSLTYNEAKSIQLLPSLLDKLISEKRMQFRSNMGIEIDLILDQNSYGIFSEVNTREFMRLLSNIINNAVEALEAKGLVTVSLTQAENYAFITISDNGCGIAPEILPGLGQKGKTYGKKDGSGLGLYHALATVKSWKGNLSIDSTLGIGTTVKISLPLAKPASWFVEQLRIFTNSTIIILDDDISIHQIWNGRFEKKNAKDFGIQILHFSISEQLIQWVTNNKDRYTSNILFLIDYEFLGFDIQGLDIIEDLGIQLQSILVTSHYEELDLRERCKRLGVQIIPKDMAAFVPIQIETKSNVDAILIDDDILVRLSWEQSARLKHKVLGLFSTAEEFIRVSNVFARDTPIYVDVNLGNNVKGDAVAKELSSFGFNNIYLATGYDPASFSSLTFIKGVIDKSPPF